MPVPILSLARMRQWEQATWASGQTEAAVIRRVGLAVAQRAERLTAAGDRILILAGKGHNGDDARAAAPALAGRVLETLNVDDPRRGLPELRAALDRRPRLVVDGLLGIGLNRPLGADWIAFLEAVNASAAPVLAVDVPSGLHADTGEHFGAAIRATITLTVGAPKLGCLEAVASPFVGRLEVAAAVGLAPCPQEGDLWWTLPGDFDGFPPARPVAGHKGTFGHVALLAGSLGYHGAAVLAARAAQRAQPGLVTLFTSPSVFVPVASQLQAAMVHPWTTAARWPETTTAVIVGPGLAASDLPAELKATVAAWWQEAALPMLADASALDWLPKGRTPSGVVRAITPHPGEAARLLGSGAAQVQADRPGAVRRLSANYGGCWVVLKGRQTLVGCEGGPWFVNGSGNPLLAQGGSGDTLAGYLGGLLAQPALAADPLTTLRYGVWQHGAAADRLSERQSNWAVEDLLAELGRRPLPHG